jgi:hypothetical protein
MKLPTHKNEYGDAMKDFMAGLWAELAETRNSCYTEKNIIKYAGALDLACKVSIRMAILEKFRMKQKKNNSFYSS